MNKVLIIDDDKELCALIKRSVLSEDIEADFCNTGKEGLQKLKEREYQLVILDVMMPGMSLIFGVLIVAASLPIVFLIIYFNKSFLLSILLAFFYSIFNWGILGTIGTSISAAKIAFLNSFPVICVMNWTSGLMMDNLQKDNLLPEAYAIVPTTFHTIFIMAITVVLSLWLIIRFYKKWTR